MARKFTCLQKSDLHEQAREARLAHFEEEKQEFYQPYLDAKADYNAKRGEIQARQNDDPDAYTVLEDGTHWKPDNHLLNEYQEEMKDWVTTPEAMALKTARDEAYLVYVKWEDENHPDNYQSAVTDRKRMKRKSKKNVLAGLEVVDHDAMHDVTFQGTSIEWSSDFDEGSLVETKDGGVGIIMEQHDLDTGRPIRPRHIKSAMLDSYIRVLVNGEVEWHTKVSVSSLSDS